jgi:hypothetical protein
MLMQRTLSVVLFLSLSHLTLANKVNPRWTTSVETKATSRNESGDRQSASEANVHGLQEDTHARSIAKGDRNTRSKSFGDSHAQNDLDFADARSDAQQDGVGTTLANSELTSNFLTEGEDLMPGQDDNAILFERAGGFPTEASLSDRRGADNRVYRNSGSSALGRRVRSSASIAGSTMLNMQTVTSQNNAHGEKASVLAAGLGFAEGRRNQTGAFDNALANGKNASVTNQSAMHSNSRAAKSETQSVANAERVDGIADTASKTQAVNIGEGSVFGNADTRNDLNVSSTLTNAKAYRSNYDAVRN